MNGRYLAGFFVGIVIGLAGGCAGIAAFGKTQAVKDAVERTVWRFWMRDVRPIMGAAKDLERSLAPFQPADAAGSCNSYTPCIARRPNACSPHRFQDALAATRRSEQPVGLEA